MKKKKIKLVLTKRTISNLQDFEMKRVLGGEEPTKNVTCATCIETKYPACGWSGCWGPRTCAITTTD